MRNDPLRNRFAFKLLGNAVGLAVSFVLAATIPRGLGVEQYGNYTFLVALLTQVLLFVELRASYFMFTSLSQRPEDRDLQAMYGYCLLAVAALFAVVVGTLAIPRIAETVFVHQETRYVFLVAGVVLLAWLNGIQGQIMDATGETIWFEKAQMLLKVAVSVAIIALAQAGALSLDSYILFQYVTQGAFALALGAHLVRKCGYTLKRSVPLAYVRRFAGELWRYCAPLVLYIAIGMVAQFVDRWLLQYYGGSRQQGLYSFSVTLSGVCVVVAGTLYPLVQREVSVLAYRNDAAAMAATFERYLPIVYGVTSYLAAFIFAMADEIVLLLGGAAYANAGGILRVGALFPMIQAYSNYHSIYFYATGRTRVYLALSLATTPVGIACAYLFTSRGNGFGLGLGGLGLVYKDLLVGLVCCLVYILVNAHYLRIPGGRHIVRFLAVPLAFVAIGSIQKVLVEHWVHGAQRLVVLAISALVYSLICGAVLWIAPGVLGFQRDELRRMARGAAQFLTGKEAAS